MTTHPEMTCPKCGGRMHSFERSSLLVDQCEDCRGFFLDGGELERLIDAEGGGWSGRVGPPAELPAKRGASLRLDLPAAVRRRPPAS